jgi:hypothetical protein
MSLTYAYAGELVKTEKTDTGDLLVYGKATGPDLDLDEQICDPKWLKSAMPRWAEWANVREQHTAIAAGVGIETEEKGDDWWVKTLVTDKGTAHKVETGTLKGYSVGIRNARVVKDAKAPGGRIVSGEIVELSLVDRPCNPTAKMAICKMAGGSLRPVNEDGAPLGDDPSTFGDGEDVAEPVADGTDVAKAVQVDTAPAAVQPKAEAVGESSAPTSGDRDSATKKPKAPRGGNLLSVRAYKTAAGLVSKALAGGLTKMADESADIAGAWAAIGQICDLIIHEATELKTGRMEEKHDIEVLLQAICYLACFLERETMQQAGSYGPDDDADMSYVQLFAKTVSAAERRRMGKAGVAMPNGDFPIPDEDHLRSAVGRLGNYTGDKAAARKHIIARAKALGLERLLPDDWNATGADDTKTADPDVTKTPTADAAVDIPEIVNKAVAEATKSHEAELRALRDELAKVAATPIPGGPVLIAPPTSTRTSAGLTKVARYRAMAEQSNDPSVREAYLALARREEATATAN